ncbi:peptide chain release factor N(5)-glutamine methyltransferase [candidate division WOR-3 bacterium]|nr:peptide chain release factor N(5)-glutamine methyltransferase [candidate division WOR-3 bacterium]
MRELVTRVRDTLCVERREAELIVAALLDRPRFSVYFNEPIDDRARTLLVMKVAQLKQGVPIEYITNRTQFLDYQLCVHPGVFIPRTETEYFVELIIKKTKRPPDSILDVGTGTGAISIALAHAFPSSTIIATDISENALTCARTNIARYRLIQRIHLVRTDMLKGLAAPFDLIVSNPPYVPRSRLHSLPKSVKYYEPLIALNGGEDGTKFTKVLIENSVPVMKDRGCIAIEIDEEAESDLTDYLKTNTCLHYSFKKDLFQKSRYVFLEKR